MTRRYFGTDGIRGPVNTGALTPDLAMRVGMAAGKLFHHGDHVHRVVIGKDTRRSGYLFEPALTAGFIAMGMDVLLVGPMPTPAVAMLVRSFRADLGVMLSASHNLHEDNGIKFFGPDGFKLTDGQEETIETYMDEDLSPSLKPSAELGRAERIEDARGRYVEFAKATLPRRVTLDGLKVVVDCAHGAAYRVAPMVLQELGAEVDAIGVSPNGYNINDGVGSTFPEKMCARVRETGADLGIALDGDADRLILCDEKGRVVDGDQIMALIARSKARDGLLKGGGLVSTVMSNMGLERALDRDGLTLERTQVGDRYVVARMRASGFNVGGEQSGHIVLSDHCTTGDGLIAALQVLAEIRLSGRPTSEVCHQFDPYPQFLKNVRFSGANPLEEKAVKKAIADVEQSLGDQGRLVIRKSGTEPKIRVMAEGEDAGKVEELVDQLVTVIADHAKG